MRVLIALSFLALAACSSAPQGSDRDGRGFSFTGGDLNASPGNDNGPCPEAAFPGGAPLDSRRNDAVTFFCEH